MTRMLGNDLVAFPWSQIKMAHKNYSLLKEHAHKGSATRSNACVAETIWLCIGHAAGIPTVIIPCLFPGCGIDAISGGLPFLAW